MWPFKKQKLNGNLIVLVAYKNSDYTVDISEKFVKTLTRKQIEMLNDTCDIRRDDLLNDEELLKEQEKKAGAYKTKEAAESKRKDRFEEGDHNLNGSPYDEDSEFAQYVKNNADKALLTKEEEEKLLKSFSDIRKKIEDAQERLSKHAHTKRDEESVKMFADMYIKSATNNKK